MLTSYNTPVLLSRGMQTAEKSPPSALDFLAQFQAASAGLMKNGRKLPQSMALTQCIQE